MNQLPPAPVYPISTVSNFSENSRRYSQLKVHHRDTGGKSIKIFNQKMSESTYR
jgi:hypothetical protein